MRPLRIGLLSPELTIAFRGNLLLRRTRSLLNAASQVTSVLGCTSLPALRLPLVSLRCASAGRCRVSARALS